MNSNISIELELSEIEIKEVRRDKKGRYHIDICSLQEKGECHKCGREIRKFHAYDRALELRHLPILGNECYLHIKLPRYECESCKKSPKTTAQLPWRRYNSSCTKAFEEEILKSLVNHTMSDVSRKENISEGKIKRMLEANYADGIDWKNYETLGQIGIDEISLKKRA